MPHVSSGPLIVGASGYVGGRLVERFRADGDPPIVAGRNPAALEARWPDLEARALDLDDPATMAPALSGVELVYYLAHSMDGRGDFTGREARAATAFGEAAAGAGVQRIVYLGGLGEGELSPHLASRQRTGRLLAGAGVPVTEFRAAVVVGSGSASFEILRHLVERLPVMITPRWVRTRCQPIAVDDVLDYLVAAARHPEVTGVVEIGGTDVLSYGRMMLDYAAARGLRRLMIPVPVLTPRLSSYWVHLVSPVPAAIAGPLIEGLRHEVVVRDPAPARALGVTPHSHRWAIDRALDRDAGTPSAWSDAVRVHRSPLASVEGLHLDRREAVVKAPPERVFAAVAAIGGEQGWPSGRILWWLRGTIDRLLGGPGLRRGRRHPTELRVGDALDFWRVEAIRQGRLVRLAAEMRLPGRAWLEWEVQPEGTGSRLVQAAYFEPRGLLGLLYWYAVLPLHALVFGPQLRAIARTAETRKPLER
jgi:uncharacterized protein YbjT (DUF2867 family)